MRLIDADKLNLLLGISDRDIYAKYMLDKMPTIDAVPVVRCKDCKHRYSDSWCEYVDDDDNFYCAMGQREEGADNG